MTSPISTCAPALPWGSFDDCDRLRRDTRRPPASSLLGLRLAGVLLNRVEEGFGGPRWLHFTAEDSRKGHRGTVQSASSSPIFSNGRACNVGSSEHSSGAGITDRVDVEGHTLFADWVCGHGSFDTHAERAGLELLHSLLIGNEDDEVDGLPAELGSPAAARNVQ